MANWIINYLQEYSKQEKPDFKLLNKALSTYKITPNVLLSDESILNFLNEAFNTNEEKSLKTLLNQMILATRDNKSLAPLGAFAITLLESCRRKF